MLKYEQDRFKLLVDPVSRPLFQVNRYLSLGGSAYVGISVAHELADGVGSLRLIDAILNPVLPVIVVPEGVPARLEDTVNIRPPFLTMINIVFHKILLPKLPTFISSYFPPDQIWPGPVTKRPMECEDTLSLLSLSPSLINGLCAARDKSARDTSIHTIVKTAWTLALMSVVDRPDLTFKAGTPRSERSPQHTLCTGNYVASLSFPFTPTLLQQHQTFWSLATAVGTYLKSEAGIQAARQTIGLLALSLIHI